MHAWVSAWRGDAGCNPGAGAWPWKPYTHHPRGSQAVPWPGAPGIGALRSVQFKLVPRPAGLRVSVAAHLQPASNSPTTQQHTQTWQAKHTVQNHPAISYALSRHHNHEQPFAFVICSSFNMVGCCCSASAVTRTRTHPHLHPHSHRAAY